MKAIIFLSLILGVFSAQAAGYSCKAESNPERGYPDAFTLSFTSLDVGGDYVMSMDGEGGTVQGKVLESTTLDASQGEAFVFILGMYNEADVSGVAPEKINDVTSVKMIKLDFQGQEVFVIQYFEGETQVGGTLSINYMATACLP